MSGISGWCRTQSKTVGENKITGVPKNPPKTEPNTTQPLLADGRNQLKWVETRLLTQRGCLMSAVTLRRLHWRVILVLYWWKRSGFNREIKDGGGRGWRWWQVCRGLAERWVISARLQCFSKRESSFGSSLEKYLRVVSASVFAACNIAGFPQLRGKNPLKTSESGGKKTGRGCQFLRRLRAPRTH